MSRNLLSFLVGASVLAASLAPAQTGDGSLRGYIKDEQGGVLPGVTVTATSPSLLAPVVALSDSTGYYRLLNLPPGTYAISAELTGFAAYRREGILMRAGSTFTVDVTMTLGSLAETITVTGESPMIETGKPASTININGELLRAAPVTSRRLFSDALDVAPGINSRNVDDGAGRRAYYFHGSHIYAHHFALEGAPASAYQDAAAHSMNMGGDMIEDVEIKLGGVDASAPLSTGVVMNVVTPRGGNAFKGSASYQFQPVRWNSDNTQSGSEPGGLPTFQSVNQWDLSLGGPVVKDKVWFYGAYRYADLTNGISRTERDLANLYAFRRDFEPFDNYFRSHQPYVKVTGQISPKHEVSAFYQNDRASFTSNREFNTHLLNFRAAGGSLVGGKLTSVWNDRLTSQLVVSYSNKGGAAEDTYQDFPGFGPEVEVHRDIFISRGLPTGTGRLVTMNNNDTLNLNPSSMLVIRGDLTYFKEGWAGSHEFKTGIWAAPRLHYDIINRFVNDGFVFEEVRQVDRNNPAAGLVPFRRRFRTPTEVQTTKARDRDIGIYVQDTWRPSPRLVLNVGVRADFVRRHDALFDIDRMKSVEIGPRVGVSYMVTGDALNVVRAFYGRLHEQVNGRDPITTFGSAAASSRTLIRDLYDADGNGIFETEIITPPVVAALSGLEIDPNLHQPYTDEFMVGFQKQFPRQLSLDVSATRRYMKDGYALVDINGIYPNGPFQPFGGFGRVDPNRGIFLQQTNRTWSQVVLTALEAVVAKNMANNFQFVMSLTRQWQHLTGTWNPTDPARFIQPDAFPNNKELSPYLFGNGDTNMLSGGGRESGVAYRPYSIRVAGQWLAPARFTVAGSYVIQAGGYVGQVVTRLNAADPVFGPSRVLLANGTTQPNPLATTIRFAFPTRSEGQTRNDTARYLQVKVGRVFELGRHRVEPSVFLFNVFNSGAHTQWGDGANQLYSPNYLRRFNRHPPRAFQLTIIYRF